MDECASAGDEGSLRAALCFFCGEPERLEIADIFTAGLSAFQAA